MKVRHRISEVAKDSIRSFLKFLGYEVSKVDGRDLLDGIPELSDDAKSMIRACAAHSMTSLSRLITNYKACQYVVDNNIAGDYVECGVWRGGNGILARKVFDSQGAGGRQVWLFDTFAGMTAPTLLDKETSSGRSAEEEFSGSIRENYVDWCYASLEEVASNFMVTNGSTNGVQFIKGDVMETLLDEANIPQRISVLRLDTDWYESTLFELQVLYRVQPGGVVILDDYGYWDGARSAVEEFFLSRSLKPLVHIIDDSGRVFVKTQG